MGSVDDKDKFAFVLVLPERHRDGLSEERLDTALATLGRFAMKRVMDRCDPRGRIPIDDCELRLSTRDGAVTLVISVPMVREPEIAAAVAAAYEELLGDIDRWGVDALIAAAQ